jgi:hypothetical protein
MRSVGEEEKGEEVRLSCFCVARWLSIKDCERIFSKRRKHHAKRSASAFFVAFFVGGVFLGGRALVGWDEYSLSTKPSLYSRYGMPCGVILQGQRMCFVLQG